MKILDFSKTKRALTTTASLVAQLCIALSSYAMSPELQELERQMLATPNSSAGVVRTPADERYASYGFVWRIVGTWNYDRMLGTSANDSMSGNTNANGFDGDWIYAGDGNDQLSAKHGHRYESGKLWEVIRIRTNSNYLHGGAGDDHIWVNEGNNFLFGGSGNDVFQAANRHTSDVTNFLGGDGDDEIRFAKGYNIIDGGAGNDRVHLTFIDQNYDGATFSCQPGGILRVFKPDFWTTDTTNVEYFSYGGHASPITRSRSQILASMTPAQRDNCLLSADFNRDGSVNMLDYSVLSLNYGKTGRTRAQGDANGDRIVNMMDFTILSSQFGQRLF